MAINFLNDVGFNKNELIQPVLENQANDASAGTPADGQLYYDTTNNVVKYGEGGSWIALATSSGTVTSVGLSMPSAFSVANSPITGAGTLTVTGAGTTSQYVRGDGSLATFPSIPTVNDSTITLTMGNGLSSSSGSFTLNQGSNETFIFTVGAGTGIQVNSGSVQIDYVGNDNAILSAGSASPAGADILWFSDDTDSTIKQATITDILALAPQGDVTAVTASTDDELKGISVSNSTGPIPQVGLDIDGQTALGATAASADTLLIYDDNASTNKKITVANLVAAAPQGDLTAIVAGSGLTGTNLSGPIPTLNVGAGKGIQVNADSVAVDYSGADNVILTAGVGTSVTLVDADDFIFSDATDNEVKYGNLSQLKTYIGAGTYTWTIAGDSGSSTVSSGQTVTINGSGTGVNAGIDVTESSRTVTVKLDLSELTTNSTIDAANDEIAFYDSNANGNAKIAPSDIHLNQWGAAEGNVNLNSNKLINVTDPTSAQDAATKAYVDSAVTGLVDFKGGFNASTGAIDGGGNLTSGGSRVAISVGDMYIVTTAGNFYGNSSYPLTVGDSVICKQDAGAGTSDINDWTIVQGDEGVVDITNSNGTFVSFGTTNTNARGSVTLGSVDLSASGSPSSSTFLRGDNQWATPTNTNTTYDLLVAQNSGSNNNPILRLDPSSGSNDDITMTGGNNITVTRNSATQFTIATSATTNTGTVTSVGITDGYLIDSSGTNPVTTSGNIQVDVDASELVDMTETILSSDEAFVLDKSETGKDQGKRKAWSEIISDLNIATGTIPSVGNGTLTVEGSSGLSGSGTFTANQSGNTTITLTNAGVTSISAGEGIDVSASTGSVTVSGEDSTASNKGIVIVAGGTGIDVSYSSGTATVSQTSGSTGGFSGPLTSATSGIARAVAGGVTTFTLTTATLFGAATNSRQCIVEVMDGTTYATVYPEVARAATTTIEVKFKGTVANDDYDISIVHAGNN